jgi:SWI/SNF-related matrix-associated actin-dependent regulator of chromatin subfamily B protein 1
MVTTISSKTQTRTNNPCSPDPIVTPEAFAQSIVEDYTLAPSYHNVIVKAIQDQLSDFKAHSANYDGESGELLPSSPTLSADPDHNDDKNNNDIQDQNCAPMRGLLDDDSIAWWERWRKRNEIAANFPSSRRRAGGVNNNNKQQRKKRKIVVDPDEDGDSHMFGDNEQEDDNDTEMEEEEREKKKEKKKKVKALAVSSDVVDSTDEDFKPMALNEIKVDEEAMHEDIRILIKVRCPLSIRIFFFFVINFVVG